MSKVLENILSRRSIRKYTKEQVSDEALYTILEAGKYAPSGGNSQSWHFTVLQNKEILLKLNHCIKEAFGRLEVYENTYRSIKGAKIAAKNDNFNFYNNAPTLIIVSNEADYINNIKDSSCALQNMFLVANDLLLGSCWINPIGWLDDDEKVRGLLTEFGIPENHKVCGSISIGYIDGDIPSPLPRKENTVTFIK